MSQSNSQTKRTNECVQWRGQEFISRVDLGPFKRLVAQLNFVQDSLTTIPINLV